MATASDLVRFGMGRDGRWLVQGETERTPRLRGDRELLGRRVVSLLPIPELRITVAVMGNLAGAETGALAAGIVERFGS